MTAAATITDRVLRCHGCKRETVRNGVVVPGAGDVIDGTHRACLRAPAPCTVRIGKPDDLAFVVDSWVKHAHRNERKRSATAHVRGLIGRAGAALYIAHVHDEPDAILGYALIEGGRPSVLHYVYVRSSARRLGVASTLLSGVVDKVIEYSAVAPRHWPQTNEERRLGCAPVLVLLPPRWVENLSRGNT